MTKYIDAEKLKRFVESIGLTPQKSADYNEGRDDVKMMVLDFIDSLQQEQQEVDLERDAVQFCFDKGLNVTPYQAKTIASHFYELGKNSK